MFHQILISLGACLYLLQYPILKYLILPPQPVGICYLLSSNYHLKNVKTCQIVIAETRKKCLVHYHDLYLYQIKVISRTRISLLNSEHECKKINCHKTDIPGTSDINLDVM